MLRIFPVVYAATCRVSVLLAVAMVLGGCAQMGGGLLLPPDSAGVPEKPTAPPLPANVEPPAPAVNLSGFPLTYRQGYADGCATATGAERKDPVRFSGDGNYRTGWSDGLALCRKK